MTVTVIGIGFGNTARESEKNEVSVSDCSATFDLSKAALTDLADCTISAPAGTWSMMTLFFSNDYTMVVDDAAGFYSDSSAAKKISTSEPSGGAATISIHDSNSPQDESGLTLTLAEPVTIADGTPPDVYVVFNPIHWMAVDVYGGAVTEQYMSGNPPIIASTSGFGKAQYYTTVGTLGAYPQSGGCGFIILYSDATTAPTPPAPTEPALGPRRPGPASPR
jgi:hypothetical protein